MDHTGFSPAHGGMKFGLQPSGSRLLPVGTVQWGFKKHFPCASCPVSFLSTGKGTDWLSLPLYLPGLKPRRPGVFERTLTDVQRLSSPPVPSLTLGYPQECRLRCAMPPPMISGCGPLSMSTFQTLWKDVEKRTGSPSPHFMRDIPCGNCSALPSLSCHHCLLPRERWASSAATQLSL